MRYRRKNAVEARHAWHHHLRPARPGGQEPAARHFGVVGDELRQMGRGQDDSPVVPLEETPDPKSIGHSLTLPRDISRRELLDFHLLRLSEMVGRRMRDGGFAGRTVCLTIRYKDFTTFSRRLSLPHPVWETPDIFAAAKSILDGIRLQQAVRLVGVSLSNLGQMPRQLPLFPAAAPGPRAYPGHGRGQQPLRRLHGHLGQHARA